MEDGIICYSDIRRRIEGISKNANSNFAVTGTGWIDRARDYTFRSTRRRVFPNTPRGIVT